MAWSGRIWPGRGMSKVIHGMQEARGSSPLSSTALQRHNIERRAGGFRCGSGVRWSLLCGRSPGCPAQHRQLLGQVRRLDADLRACAAVPAGRAGIARPPSQMPIMPDEGPHARHQNQQLLTPATGLGNARDMRIRGPRCSAAAPCRHRRPHHPRAGPGPAISAPPGPQRA